MEKQLYNIPKHEKVQEFQDTEKLIKQLHQFIFSQGGKTTFECLHNKFPDVKDVKALLLLNPALFWFAELSERIWDVHAKIDVNLCYLYVSSTCPGSCSYLHMCPQFLLSERFCSETCKYGLSHDIHDEHNEIVIQSTGIEYSELSLVRSSFPRICKLFEHNGKCDKLFCGYLHVCPYYVAGSCKRNCIFYFQHYFDAEDAHNFHTEHNRSVLESFKLSPSIKDTNILLANILIPKHKYNTASKLEHHGYSTCTVMSSYNDTLVPEKIPIVLCKFYLDNNCKKKFCHCLHMCKDFLDSSFSCKNRNCQFGFSHDPLDRHNQQVMNAKGVGHLQRPELLKLLRNSFPRLCMDYKKNRACSTKCRSLHICTEFMYNRCRAKHCSLSHDFKDVHNTNVLKVYSLDKIKEGKGKRFLTVNVMHSKKQVLNNTRDGDVSKAGDDVWNPAHASTESTKIRREKSFPAKSEGSNDLQHSPKPNICSQGMESEIKTEVKSKKPSTEEAIFDYIISMPSHCCSISDTNILAHFDDKKEDAEKWLTQQHHTFRMVTDKMENVTMYVCLQDVRACQYYWKKGTGCQNNDCEMFHICKKFLLQESHSQLSCKYNHGFDDIHEKNLIREFKLDKLTDNQIIKLLQIRYPFVCLDYQHKKCTHGEDLCPSLHVCNLFMQGKCKKPDGLCNFKHESGLNGVQARRLMENFHLEEKEFHSCLMLPKTKTELFKVVSDTAEFNTLQEEAVCSKFVVDNCQSGSSCALQHPCIKLPFAWQYKRQTEDIWTYFNTEHNMNLEKNFCDPSLDRHRDNNLVVVFDSHEYIWNGYYKKQNVQVRRLSTKSTVKGEQDEAGLTEWKWYWCKVSEPSTRTDWEEYSGQVSSADIERCYLEHHGTIKYLFKTAQFQYKLSFVEMKQQNLDERYKTERDVVRRPAFKGSFHTTRENGSEICSIPQHWPINSPGMRIHLISTDSNYVKIKSDFEMSVDMKVELLQIEEICNVEFFEKYQSKKRALARKLSDVKEKFLYHGTDYQTVEAICRQNFDWRICGKNATVYGQGCYFATTAKYSHSYSTPNDAGIYYMFYAQVLVGNYTQGSSSFKRPPSLDAKGLELYDSCVNNEINPSIYVIFERDQCYPKYLISYKIKHDELAATYRQTYRHTYTKRISSSTNMQSVLSGIFQGKH